MSGIGFGGGYGFGESLRGAEQAKAASGEQAGKEQSNSKGVRSSQGDSMNLGETLSREVSLGQLGYNNRTENPGAHLGFRLENGQYYAPDGTAVEFNETLFLEHGPQHYYVPGQYGFDAANGDYWDERGNVFIAAENRWEHHNPDTARAFDPPAWIKSVGQSAPSPAPSPMEPTVPLHEIVPGADLRGRNLSGLDLAGKDLRGINLSGANLEGTNLSGANLEGTNLSGANLQDADFTNANVRGANLEGSTLIGVRYEGVQYDARTNVNNVILEAPAQTVTPAPAPVSNDLRGRLESLGFTAEQLRIAEAKGIGLELVERAAAERGFDVLDLQVMLDAPYLEPQAADKVRYFLDRSEARKEHFLSLIQNENGRFMADFEDVMKRPVAFLDKLVETGQFPMLYPSALLNTINNRPELVQNTQFAEGTQTTYPITRVPAYDQNLVASEQIDSEQCFFDASMEGLLEHPVTRDILKESWSQDPNTGTYSIRFFDDAGNPYHVEVTPAELDTFYDSSITYSYYDLAPELEGLPIDAFLYAYGKTIPDTHLFHDGYGGREQNIPLEGNEKNIDGGFPSRVFEKILPPEFQVTATAAALAQSIEQGSMPGVIINVAGNMLLSDPENQSKLNDFANNPHKYVIAVYMGYWQSVPEGSPAQALGIKPNHAYTVKSINPDPSLEGGGTVTLKNPWMKELTTISLDEFNALFTNIDVVEIPEDKANTIPPEQRGFRTVHDSPFTGTSEYQDLSEQAKQAIRDKNIPQHVTDQIASFYGNTTLELLLAFCSGEQVQKIADWGYAPESMQALLQKGFLHTSKRDQDGNRTPDVTMTIPIGGSPIFGGSTFSIDPGVLPWDQGSYSNPINISTDFAGGTHLTG